MKNKILILYVSALLLSGCAFMDKGYAKKGNEDDSSSDIYEDPNYDEIPTNSISSYLPAPDSINRDVAYSTSDMNFLLSAAITQHDTDTVVINCDFDHSVETSTFIEKYLENNYLVDVTCDTSVLFGHKGRLSTHKFNITYHSPSNYAAPNLGTNVSNAKYLNRIIRQRYSGNRIEYFYIDNVNYEINVFDSEGLWWAVSHGFRPIIYDNNLQKLYDNAKELLKNIISVEDDAYDIARNIYDYLVTECVYDNDFVNADNTQPYCLSEMVEGVIYNKKATHDGFSKAYALLTGMLGVHSIRTYGFSNPGLRRHSWNYVMLNHAYHLVCTSWGRQTKGINRFNDEYSFIDYAAFCNSSNYFKARGTFFMQYNNDLAVKASLESPLERDVITEKTNYKIDSALELSDILMKAKKIGFDGSYLVLQDGRIEVTKELIDSTMASIGLGGLYNILEIDGHLANGNVYRIFYFTGS